MEEVDRVLELCRKYNIQVVIDVHGLRWSQNGLDNSGQTENLQWDNPSANHLPLDEEPEQAANNQTATASVAAPVSASVSSPSAPADSGAVDTAEVGVVARFTHWSIRGGDWAGTYDTISKKYSVINETHINFSLRVVEAIADMYTHEPSVVGFTPGDINSVSQHFLRTSLKNIIANTQCPC